MFASVLHVARSPLCRGFFAFVADLAVVQCSHTVGSFFVDPRRRLPRFSTGNQPTMSLRGLKAWFGRGAEEDEDETMVRDQNV